MSNPVYRILLVVPPASVLAYIIIFGVNIPFSVDWGFVTFIKAYNNNDAWVRLVFQQHNEHRMFFSNLLRLPLAQATGWDLRAEMVLSWLISCVGFYILLRLMKENGLGRQLLILMSFLYFSLGQGENILWGWQICLYLTEVCAIAAFYFLGRINSNSKYFIPSAAAGVIASFSFSSGLLIWPTGAIQILLSDLNKKKKLVMLSSWAAVSLSVFIIYFRGYTWNIQNRKFLSEGLLSLTGFIVAETGALFSGRTVALAVAFGIIIVFLFLSCSVSLYRKGLLPKYLEWFALGIFSFASLAMIAYGRADAGIGEALAPRYSTVALFAIMPAVVLGYASLKKGTLPFILVILLFSGVVVSDAYGLLYGRMARSSRMESAACVIQGKQTWDSHLDPILTGYTKDNADYLRANRLSLFKAEF